MGKLSQVIDQVQQLHLHNTGTYTKGDIENGYMPISNNIIGITRVFNFGGAATNNTRDGQLFDLMYQFRMNDLYNLMGADMVYYTVVQSHLTTLEKLISRRTTNSLE